jgi:hypothetical protein
MNIDIKRDVPDFSFVILENKPDTDVPIDVIRWDSVSQRLRSVGTIQTILDMNELMSKAFEICNPDIWFAPDFPEFLLPRDNPSYKEMSCSKAAPQVPKKVITWGVVRKEPGTVSGPPFGGTQEVKPRHREYIAIFNDQTKNYVVGNTTSGLNTETERFRLVKVKAQVFDNLVQYNIWSKSNYEAEIMMEWFEDFMDKYTGMFREAGIVQLLFNRRVRDETLFQMKNGYHARSGLYYVRTERVSVDSISPIKRINLNISTQQLLKSVDNINDQLSDYNLYDKIIDKWIRRNTIGG